MLSLKQKKSDKNFYGYLKKGKRTELLKTVLLFATSFFLYLIGFLLSKTNRNVFTIISILGILPASKHLVHLLVFMRGTRCLEEDHEQIRKFESKLDIYYDFIFTTHNSNYYVESLFVHEHHIIGFHKNDKDGNRRTEAYLRDVVIQNGYHNYTVKISDDLHDYQKRLQSISDTIHKKNDPAHSLKSGKQSEALISLLKAISI